MGDGFNKTDVSNGIIYAAYTPTERDRSADVKRVIKTLSDVDLMNKIYRLSIKLNCLSLRLLTSILVMARFRTRRQR